VGPNPILGVVFHWLGGLSSGSCYLPFRGIRHWAWETYWLLQGVISWIMAPILIGLFFVPGLIGILHQAPPRSLALAYFWGFMWGFGGLTFGLSVRYLGQSLGYAIALGLTAAFGTLMPPLFSGELDRIATERSGQVILGGVAVCLFGIVLTAIAGRRKERELSVEDKRGAIKEFAYVKGVMVAVFAGVMSACFAYGLAAGKPIAVLSKAYLQRSGRTDLWQNLPVLVVVLLGGFTSNFIWAGTLVFRNRTVSEYLGVLSPKSSVARSLGAAAATQERLDARTLLCNYIFSISTGLMWYFQFFFYSMGQTKMGKYDFSSWTLHMASIIIFSTLWGLWLKEWKGSRQWTQILVGMGLTVLILSTIIVGLGNYLKLHEGRY
jgi:L-rhamnose-H+ transport protein